jgi:predicted RNase H-like HicB family nuclease
MYPVILTPDENGTVLVTCADLPEVTTFGEDEEDAIGRAADAVEEALAARIARREDIPAPSMTPQQAILEALAARFGARAGIAASSVVPDRTIEAALAASIVERGDIQASSVLPHQPTGFLQGWLGVPDGARAPELNLRIVRLPPLTMAKVELYRAVRAAGVSKAELGRRLGWHGPQVDRLFDLNHHSAIEHIDQALRVIGKRLEVSVRDAM